MKHRKYEELEKVSLEWFQQVHSLNYPMNGCIVPEKAKQIAARLNITKFCASTRWLDQFQNRHGIM